MTDGPTPGLMVTDAALAKLAAQAAVAVSGVARLSPTLPYLVKDAVTDLARRLTTRDSAEPDQDDAADPDAVEVVAELARVEVTVRIIATGTPPVLATVNAVQRAVRREIARIDSRPSSVTVMVVDAEPE